MDGFVHELQVFENCQYLATKNSHLSQKIIKIILLTNVCVNPTLQDSFDSFFIEITFKHRNSCICKSQFHEFLQFDLTEKNST